MIKVLVPLIFLLALANARITVPIMRRYIPDSAINDITSDTAQSFLRSDDEKSTTTYHNLNLTMKNSRNLFYFGQLYVGKNTTFQVLIDSGSNILWLPTTDCVGCPAKTKYVCNASSTCMMTSKPFELQYGLGYAAGYVGSEMVGFTQDFQVNATLIWVNRGRDLANYKDTDGFIGLGNMEQANDYIDLAYKKNYIQDKVFSFYLDHNAELDVYSNSSYLAIGYIPEDKVNKLTWIPVTNPNRWSTEVLGMKVGNTSVDFRFDPNAHEVLFDSGASLLLLAPVLIRGLTNQLENFSTINIEDIKLYRCDAEYMERYPNITVSVNNMEIILNAYTYLYLNAPVHHFGKNYCQLAAVRSTLGFQIFGDAFLKNNFVAFSKKNQSMGIYQEYRPIVLPPAPNNNWLLAGLLVVAVIAAVFIFQYKKKNVSNLEQALNQEQNDVYSSRIEASS